MSRSHCPGSSPGKPNIKELNELKKKLRKLDRELCDFYRFTKSNTAAIYQRIDILKFHKLLKKDEKRKEVRNKLKGYI